MTRSQEAKRNESECVCLHRRGDFLVAYGRDAEIVAEVLDLTITTQRRGFYGPLKCASFLAAMLDSFSRRLANAGYRVAVLDE